MLPRLLGSRPAETDPDADMVARARAGEEAAFEALLSRHERQVWRVAVRILGNRDDALDAVQETFLRVWRSLPSFRGAAQFRTWVIGIAINVCRNRLASASFRARRLSSPIERTDPTSRDAGPLPVPDPAPGPERVAYAAELRLGLEVALAALRPEHREVLVLREIEGLEYDAIAAALQIRVGTVKSRLARARATLRQNLKGTWP